MAIPASELFEQLNRDHTGELTETIDVMLDILIERLRNMREGSRRYESTKLGIAFLLGLRDRLVE